MIRPSALLLSICLLLPWPGPVTAQAAESGAVAAPEQPATRMEPWRAARFGMFIHWGPIALRGAEIGWSRGAQVPIDEYDALYRRFTATKFDADAWASVAKAAGMKYVVLTTKHHDGFCLWDTRQTEYSIMRTPFGRDATRLLADACRRQGLAFGVYYSTCDWHHPDFPLTSPGGRVRRAVSDLDRYTAYLKAQTAELVTGYGPLFTIWFDVPQCFDAVRGQGVIDHLRALQPDLVINNRTGAAGDYDTPEQRIGGFGMERPWETCMTICRQWAWKPDDEMKPLAVCVRTLLQTIGGDGNLLFNVGPTPEGEIEPRQAARLAEMGAWISPRAASIYGTRGGPFKPGPWGAATRGGNRITLFVMRWPADGRLALPGIAATITGAATVDGTPVAVQRDTDGRLMVHAPPAAQRDPIATTIVLTLDVPAMSIAACSVPDPDGDLAEGRPATASGVYRGMDAFGASKAVDGDAQTRWATDDGTKDAWLDVDLGAERSVARAVIDEGSWNRVRRFEIQVKAGESWKPVAGGEGIGANREVAFPAAVSGRFFRLRISDATEAPTIAEFKLYH